MTMPKLPPILSRAAAMYEGEPLTDEVHAYARQYAAEVAAPAVEALRLACQFITNGIALGYIRMPDADTPDTAHQTPSIVRAALEANRSYTIPNPVGSPTTPEDAQ